MTMKVAIVGSREYTNKRRIQEFIHKLKERWGNDLEIVSGGQKDGADGYAKKYSLEFMAVERAQKAGMKINQNSKGELDEIKRNILKEPSVV